MEDGEIGYVEKDKIMYGLFRYEYVSLCQSCGVPLELETLLCISKEEIKLEGHYDEDEPDLTVLIMEESASSYLRGIYGEHHTIKEIKVI